MTPRQQYGTIASSARIFSVLVLATCATAVLPDGAARHVLFDLLVAGSAGFVWHSARGSSQRATTAQRLVAAGLTLWALGDIVWDVINHCGSGARTASVADAFQGFGYPLVAAGVLTIVRMRSTAGQREGVLDGMALGLAAAVAAWQALVTPSMRAGMRLPSLAAVALYPVMDALLLACVAWLILIPGKRHPALLLLTAGLGLTFASDLSYALMAQHGYGVWLGTLRPLHVLAIAAIAAAVTHPRLAEPTGFQERTTRAVHPGRLVCLAGALYTASLAGVLQRSTDSMSAGFVALATCAVSTVVIVRFALAVHQRDAAEAGLAFAATHDSLTGLANREAVLDRLRMAIARSRRGDTRVAVLYLDLDRFKKVNDTFGHAAGDRVLMETSVRLCEVVREADTVGRLGGDEFVVICEITDPAEALAIARRIVAAVSRPIRLPQPVVVSTSVGVAFADDLEDADQPETLLRLADSAMYHVKEGGGDRWETFDRGMWSWAEEQRDLADALRLALSRKELRLVYQPLVAMATGRIASVEALLRWTRADGTNVSPATFVPIAEELGLIISIGEWVFEEACRQLTTWQEADFAEEIRMNVNVTSAQIMQPTFAESIKEVLDRYGVPPNAITLEITEGALLADTDLVRSQLQALRDLGVKWAIDDFGTGYSSLAYLQTFPIDEVKIDRQLVIRLGNSPRDNTIVGTIIELAHALGLAVVSEGIEHQEQYDTLRDMGCEFGQGFLMHRPQEAAAIGTLLDLDRLPRALTGRAG